MIPVVELLRVSTESQAGEDRAGLAGQHDTNLRTCASFGLEVVEQVQIVESGATVAKSAEMAHVLDLVTRGSVRGIVLAEYSRLFRPDRWDDMIVLQTLSDYDARIFLPTGPIDLQSEIGFVQATVNNLLAAMERRRIRERMHRGKEERRRRGEHMAGGCGIPSGMAYSKAEGWTYTPDIERVRELFRRFLAGEHVLARLADDLGFSRPSIPNLLKNPIYSGWRIYTQRRDLSPAGVRPGNGDRRKIARDDRDVIRVRLPIVPVVSEQDFATVQLMLEARRAAPRTSHSSEFLYRGLLHCASCNVLVYTHQKSPTTPGASLHNYHCRTPIRNPGAVPCTFGNMTRERLEPMVDAAVIEYLTDVDFLTTAIASYNDSIVADWRTSASDTGVVDRQRDELQRRRSRVMDLYVAGHIDATDREARLAPIDSELRGLGSVQRAPAAIPAGISTDMIGSIVGAFAEWSFLGWSAKRRILEALAPRFVVSKAGVEGAHFPMAAFSSCNSASRSPRGDPLATAQTLYIPFRRAG